MKKISIILFSFVLLAALILGAFKFINLKNKQSCRLSGGRWIETGAIMSNGEPSVKYCYYPPADEGRQCYQNSDCLKECVSTSKTDSEGYILGVCGEYSVFVCTPTIPTKTKNRNSLKGGSCV